MPKPLKEVLKENLENSGLSKETLAAIASGNMDHEVSDDEIAAVSTTIGTETKFEPTIVAKHKDKFVADGEKKITDLLKANHEKLAASLTGQKLADYEKLTTELERNQFLFDHFQNGLGDGDYKALQKKMENVIAKQKTDFVPKSDYDTLANEVAPAYQGKLKAEISNRATRHKGIAPSRKDEKFFENNFNAEVDAYINAKGYKVDPKTGKVLKSDGTPEISKNNLPMTHLDLVDEVVEANADYWGVKSDPVETAKTTTTTTPAKSGDPVKDKNLARAKAEAAKG